MPATEWISSTITVSTPVRVSRADEVSIRYSDSGVVMRMSGGSADQGAPPRLGRVSGSHAYGDAGARRACPGRGVGDAGEWPLQVAFDVHGQRLER
ncbi:hypothetical protein GCM10023353_24440 [Tomitella cavernea]|uniref:Uncharacterized protein n=1 Tax=Tomitella cavernea TaxID=1387982 RepID=A0ABP9CWR5_9ACTN